MWSDIEFLNSDWMAYIIPGSIILLVIFIWKEWKTNSGTRLFLLIGLTVISIGSLIMLALKPAVPHLISGDTVIILTKNYQQAKLDSLMAIYPKAEKINYYETGDLTDSEAAGEVFILGNGLKPYDFHKIEAENNPNFIPGEMPEGIVQLKFSQDVSIGDSIKIKGLYKKPVPGTRLVLEDFSGNSLDSVKFSETNSEKFQLNAKTTVGGNYLYNLTLKDSAESILRSDVLPITITDRSALKILILNSYPLFETKYLKEFLGREANEVSLKTRISKGRYKYEFVNTESHTLGKLTAEFLKEYDLLIIDSDYLDLLRTGETNAITEAMNTGGLGVFIQPGEDFFKGRQEIFQFNFVNDQNAVRLNFEASEKLVKHDYLFSSQETLIPIIENKGRIYAAYKLRGSGKIGSWVLDRMYQLVLNGDIQTYEYLWSRVINTLSGKKSIAVEWKIENFPVYKNEPVSFTLRTNFSKPRVQTGYNILVPLSMDTEIPNLWSGLVYPSKTGWNHLAFTNDSLSATDYYVFEDSSWEALNNSRIREANLKRFSNRSKENVPVERLKPINQLWFFIIFLISVFFLWLIPKL